MSVMEQVLDLIAESVSALVVAIADSEDKGKLFGDMVGATELIQQAVGGMIDAANETLQTIDEEFHPIIRQGSSALRDACQELVNAAHAARHAPHDRTPQRDAIAAAKKILQKVTLLVLVEDQSNIKNLVMVAKEFALITKRACDARNDTQLGAIAQEQNTYKDAVVERVQQRGDGKKFPEYIGKLQKAVEVVNYAPQHQSTAIARRNMGDASAAGEIEAVTQDILSAVDDLIEIVKLIFHANSAFAGAAFTWQPIRTLAEDDVLNHSRNLNARLAQLPRAIDRGEGLSEAKALTTEIRDLLHASKEVLEKCEDPTKRALVGMLHADLERLAPQLIAGMKAVMANPEDAAARARLNALMAQAQDANTALANAINQTPEQILAANASRLADKMDQLYTAIANGDRVRAAGLLQEALTLFDRELEMARALAATITDPVLREEMENSIRELQRLRDLIQAKAKYCIDHPEDRRAQQELAQLIRDAKAILQTISRPYQTVQAAGGEFVEQCNALAKAVQEGGPAMPLKAAHLAKTIADSARRQIIAAEEHAAQLNDPVRAARVREYATQLKQDVGRIVADTKAVIESPDDQNRKNKLLTTLEQAKDTSTSLSDTCKPTAAELQRYRDEAKRKYDAAHGPPKQPVSMSLKVTGPVNSLVFQAAQNVEEALRGKQAAEGTPLRTLQDVGHSIAQEMASMAAFAAQRNKRGMIDSARKVVSLINKVMEMAKLVADNCKDPILKQQLLGFANSLPNYAVQLKMISTVKAATDDDDPTVEDQLVTCAQNLSKAVIKTADMGEICSIKCITPWSQMPRIPR